jgi:hypothetical protein
MYLRCYRRDPDYCFREFEIRMQFVCGKKLGLAGLGAWEGRGGVVKIVGSSEEEGSEHQVRYRSFERGEKTQRAMSSIGIGKGQPALHRPPTATIATAMIEVSLRINTIVRVPSVKVLPLAIKDCLIIGTVNGILPSFGRPGVHVSIEQELRILSRIPDPEPIRIRHLSPQINRRSGIGNSPEFADGRHRSENSRMASNLDLRAGPPERPTLRVVCWEASHAFVAFCVVFQLALPGFCLSARNHVAEDYAAAVADEVHEAFRHCTTLNSFVSIRLITRKGKLGLTILHDVLEVNLRDCPWPDLAYQLCFLMAGLYDAFVGVDDFLLVLGRDDRLFEL